MAGIGLLIMLIGTVLLSSGCAETTIFRTYPPGAAVTINGRSAGTSPVVVRVPRGDFPSDGIFRYHAEHEGYRPADGEFHAIPAPGRVVAAIFTLGIHALFRGTSTLPETVDVLLESNNVPSVTSQTNDDAAKRLRRLERLHDEGSIDDEEYRRERSKILHNM